MDRTDTEAKMSKKDYQALATALYRQRPEDHWCANKRTQWTMDVKAVEDVLAAGNPRFSRERFQEACETGKCRGMRQASKV